MYVKVFKRILDFVFSFLILIAISPTLLVLTVLGWLFMRGNPFFLQERAGQISRRTGTERIFRMVKFRSMTNQKGPDGDLLPDADRLTGYGRFLRSTSLDELPELINILMGQMSFVGPRPLLPEYLPRYSPEQRRRHLVPPGLTGWAQIHGRNESSWEDRFEKDLWYVHNQSFLLDVQIVLKTIGVVLRSEGISSDTAVTKEDFLGTGTHIQPDGEPEHISDNHNSQSL